MRQRAGKAGVHSEAILHECPSKGHKHGGGGREGGWIANTWMSRDSPIASCHWVLEEVECARLLTVLHLLKQEMGRTELHEVI